MLKIQATGRANHTSGPGMDWRLDHLHGRGGVGRKEIKDKGNMNLADRREAMVRI